MQNYLTLAAAIKDLLIGYHFIDGKYIQYKYCLCLLIINVVSYIFVAYRVFLFYSTALYATGKISNHNIFHFIYRWLNEFAVLSFMRLFYESLEALLFKVI